MSKKYALLFNWVNTIADYKEIERLPEGRLKNAPLYYYDKLNMNYMFVKMINRLAEQPGFEKIVIYGLGSIAVAANGAKKAGIIDSNKIVYSYFTNLPSFGAQSIETRIDAVIRSLAGEGVTDFIMIDSMKYITELYKEMSTFFHTVKNVRLIPIAQSLFDSGWGVFKNWSEECFERAYCFANSNTAIINQLAFFTGRPEDAVFIESPGTTEHPQARRYLFDYYPTSRDARIKEEFSVKLRMDIKNENPTDDAYSLFFFKALEAYLKKNEINIHECGFVVLPSHSENRWNDKIVRGIRKVFNDPYHLPNLTTLLRRNETVTKQSTSGERRTMHDHTRTLEVSQGIPQKIKYLFLIDDITTSGASFEAAEEVLSKTSFEGAIIPFAVAGTQNSSIHVSQLRRNLISYHKRQTNTCAYIFDLDGTLVDSSAIKAYRDHGEWKKVFYSISQVRPYRFLAETVKALVRREREVAIVTSAPRMYAEMILRSLGIIPESVILVCYHDTHDHKPAAEPYYCAYSKMTNRAQNVLCFGDMEEDIQACAEANENRSTQRYKGVLVNFNRDQRMPDFGQDYSCCNEMECMELIYPGMNAFFSENQLFDMLSRAVKNRFFDDVVLQEWISRLPLQQYRHEDGYTYVLAMEETMMEALEQGHGKGSREYRQFSHKAAFLIMDSTYAEDFAQFIRQHRLGSM